MLDIPAVDPEPAATAADLDIQTALCLMNIPFALCLTPEEYRRAVHSIRLDASLLTARVLTGDNTFLGGAPGLPPVRVDSNVDVPRTVYEHAVRLRVRPRPAASARRPLTPASPRARAGRNRA